MKLYELATGVIVLVAVVLSYVGSVGVRVEEPKTVKEIAVVVKADAKKVEVISKKAYVKVKAELKKVVPSTLVVIND